jgi:hypothetical protein
MMPSPPSTGWSCSRRSTPSTPCLPYSGCQMALPSRPFARVMLCRLRERWTLPFTAVAFPSYDATVAESRYRYDAAAEWLACAGRPFSETPPLICLRALDPPQ